MVMMFWSIMKLLLIESCIQIPSKMRSSNIKGNIPSKMQPAAYIKKKVKEKANKSNLIRTNHTVFSSK